MSKTIEYLHIEPSTLCNAACPCCPRYNANTPLTGEGLYTGYISIDKFKEWFPPSVLNRVNRLTFCGNHGDPCTNPDLPKIFDYLSNFEFKRCVFNTNGGMKTAKFWKELAEACNKCNFPIVPVFSIDGLQDTNHIYRRNVKWENLIRNLKSFLNTFNKPSNVVWDYLVFHHNQHQIKEAKALSIELGIGSIQFKHPLNLDDGENITPIPSLDKDGGVLYWINPSDLNRFKPSYLPENPKVVKKDKKPAVPVQQVLDWDGTYDENELKMLKEFDKVKINPRCRPNDLYVEADGTVHQCCFVANGFYNARLNFKNNKKVPIYTQNYLKTREKFGENNFDLNYTSIEKMEELDVLNKLNTYSWYKSIPKGKSLVCSRFCGKKQGLDELYESQNGKYDD